jgi:hypothetical protein
MWSQFYCIILYSSEVLVGPFQNIYSMRLSSLLLTQVNSKKYSGDRLFHLHRRVGMKYHTCFIPTCLWRWNRQSAPKRWYWNYRRRWFTQKKAYDIQTTAKIWNQEETETFDDAFNRVSMYWPTSTPIVMSEVFPFEVFLHWSGGAKSVSKSVWAKILSTECRE